MQGLATETLLEIFKYLLPGNLFAVIRVNRRWFYCGISVLWRLGRCFYLAAVAPDRRQIYASVIQFLNLRSENYKQLANISFPRLKDLSIQGCSSPQNQIDLTPDPGRHEATVEDLYLKHYMQPCLEGIDISGKLDTALLTHINTKCLHFRRIQLYSPGLHVSAELFLDFLKEAKSLEEVTLDGQESIHLVSAKTLEHLAERNNLKWLSLDFLIDKHLMAIPNVLQPFASLQHLCIKVTQDTIPRMVEVAKSVRALRVTIIDGLNQKFDCDGEINSVVLSHLSQLIELRSLHIFVWGKMNISTPNIVALRNLRNLEDLELTGINALALMALKFKDSDFRQLVSSFRRLRQLDLQIYRTQLTAASLRALGKYCKLLTSCELMGAFNMLLLKSCQAPLFPNLESFTIGSFRSSIDIPPEDGNDSEPEEEKYKPRYVRSMVRENALQIARHFPKLDWVHCNYRTDFHLIEEEFSNKIFKSWDRILERRKKLGHD